MVDCRTNVLHYNETSAMTLILEWIEWFRIELVDNSNQWTATWWLETEENEDENVIMSVYSGMLQSNECEWPTNAISIVVQHSGPAFSLSLSLSLSLSHIRVCPFPSLSPFLFHTLVNYIVQADHNHTIHGRSSIQQFQQHFQLNRVKPPFCLSPFVCVCVCVCVIFSFFFRLS